MSMSLVEDFEELLTDDKYQERNWTEIAYCGKLWIILRCGMESFFKKLIMAFDLYLLRRNAAKLSHCSTPHWVIGERKTLRFLSYHYGWLRLVSNTYTFLWSCNSYQVIKGMPHYHMHVNRPIIKLCEFFSIALVGPIVATNDWKKK